MRPRNRWPHRLLLSRMKKRGSGDPSSPGGSLALPVDAAHAEVFDFEEFLDAVFRALPADVAAVEIGGEAKFDVVGHLDGLGVGLKAVERCDRHGHHQGETFSPVAPLYRFKT